MWLVPQRHTHTHTLTYTHTHSCLYFFTYENYDMIHSQIFCQGVVTLTITQNCHAFLFLRSFARLSGHHHVECWTSPVLFDLVHMNCVCLHVGFSSMTCDRFVRLSSFASSVWSGEHQESRVVEREPSFHEGTFHTHWADACLQTPHGTVPSLKCLQDQERTFRLKVNVSKW